MSYNVFKVDNIEKLKIEMSNASYHKKGKRIDSGKYSVELYDKSDNEATVSWKEIYNKFSAELPGTKNNISSIVLCESKENNYAITYGASSFLVQKFCDKEFAFNFAKRIKLTELKRKSSITPYSTKNSSITVFKNTNDLIYDAGENVTSLSFKPKEEFYGSRVDIGKSIKFQTKIPIEEINTLLDKIEEDLKNEIINNIPLLVKIKDQELIEQYNEIMYCEIDKLENVDNIYNSNDSLFSEFNVVGTSFYFDEESKRVVKIGKNEINVEINNIRDLVSFSKKNGLKPSTIIQKAKIIHYNDEGEKLFVEPLIKNITFEIEEEKVSLFGGEWFQYNEDFYHLVINNIRSIETKYDKQDDCTDAELEKYRDNYKEYREQLLNKMLKIKHNGVLLDRDLAIGRFEDAYLKSKYKVEIADLVIDDEYISLKIGETQKLCYCVDQSELAAKLITTNSIDLKKYRIKPPKSYGLWFYTDTQTIFENDKVHLEKFKSIMLLSKISTWSITIRSLGKEPIIHVNKFFKK